jgi:hypothetical protein
MGDLQMTAALEDRISELEEFTRRVIPATEGWPGIQNYVQRSLLDERKSIDEFLTEVVALLQREFLAQTKAMLDQALAQRICGTYSEKQFYSACDVVAKDGGSFIARRDNPGPCPGDGWQLVARQGQRGVAGPRGERGPPGREIVRWILDREHFLAIPVMSDGKEGPALELRELFVQFQSEAT